MCSDIFLLLPYPMSSTLCQITPWIGHTAFYLAYSSLLAKTYRIAKIFYNSKSLQVSVTTDFDLFRAIGIGLVFLWVIMGVWTGIDPPKPTEVSNGITSYTVCKTTNLYFTAIILSLECLWLAVFMFICFVCRNIPEEFNEVKSIRSDIWISCLFCFVFFLLFWFVCFLGSLLPFSSCGLLFALTYNYHHLLLCYHVSLVFRCAFVHSIPV